MAHTGTQVETFGERHFFLIRRLHSLMGLMPVGVFLVMHLSINASINFSADAFQANVDRIHSLGPLLTTVEVVGIFLPLLFHSVLGMQIWLSGQSNVGAYPYGGNVRYTLQRITGIIAFVFIFYHLWHMHWLGGPFGGSFFRPEDAALTTADAIRHTVFGIPVSIFYVVGVLATVYHLANGIWTSLITWGVTIGPESQRTAGYACAVLGVVLSVFGVSSIQAFREYRGPPETVEVDSPPPHEIASSDLGSEQG